MKPNTQQIPKLPSRFSMYTERLLGYIATSIIDACLIKFMLLPLLAYCGVVGSVIDWNFASVFAVIFTLNWWFGLAAIRQNSRTIQIINHNVAQILNMSAIMVLKNSVQTLSNLFVNDVKDETPDDKDDNNVDKL